MPFPSDKIEDIASNLIAIGASVVLLTGGEPFLRDDIIEIVKIFKTKGLDVRMQTAGLLKRFDIIKKCSQYGVNDINVSIDSLDENLSDYLNGRSGSWRQAIQTIGRICREFPKKSSVCAFGCVLSPYNIDHIESVLDLATELGWWLSLVPAHTNPPEKNLFFRGMDHYFIFQEEDYPKVAALINRLKKRKRQGDHLFDSIEYLDSIRHFIEHGTPSWRKNNLCDTPHLYFAIKPDGRFAPCCDHDFIEDIYVYDKEFPKIFKSKSFQDKVTTIAQNCPGCNFGSYPEMTLTVRSFSTLLERVRLQFRSSRIQHRTIEDDQLFNLIDSIKQKYPVYSRDNTMPRRQEKYSIPKH
jgi:MoaA/NifB/PqqE/SkfB family radical SAM enzyme